MGVCVTTGMIGGCHLGLGVGEDEDHHRLTLLAIVYLCLVYPVGGVRGADVPGVQCD